MASFTLHFGSPCGHITYSDDNNAISSPECDRYHVFVSFRVMKYSSRVGSEALPSFGVDQLYVVTFWCQNDVTLISQLSVREPSINVLIRLHNSIARNCVTACATACDVGDRM